MQITDIIAAALVRQPWYVQRKDTITAVLGTLLQVLNLAAAFTTTAPSWVTITIAVLIGLIQAFIHAGTRGAITPSMGPRLEEIAAQVVGHDTPDSARAGGVLDALLLGARAAEAAGTATPNAADVAGGSHRGDHE